jgi:hypothetical protein
VYCRQASRSIGELTRGLFTSGRFTNQKRWSTELNFSEGSHRRVLERAKPQAGSSHRSASCATRNGP